MREEPRRLTLNVQHGDERGEDLGFGPFHHVLVGLQDALQDEGEGRQDVGGRGHHAGRAERETLVRDRGREGGREGGRIGRLNELSRQERRVQTFSTA